MNVASRLVHRAVIERNATITSNTHGHPDPEVFATHETIPCLVWSRTKTHLNDEDKEVILEDMRAIFTRDADVTLDDQIDQIEDRAGTVLFGGPIRIEAIVRKRAHVEAILRRINAN